MRCSFPWQNLSSRQLSLAREWANLGLGRAGVTKQALQEGDTNHSPAPGQLMPETVKTAAA